MKTALKVVGAVLLLAVLTVAGGYAWASVTTNRVLSETYEAHAVDFPVPFPLGEESIAVELAPEEVDGLALDLAIERGRHLVTARYHCIECHGANLAGGTMIDAFPIGRLLGPNLTGGAGSRTLAYTAVDWDRTVRHGILPDGRPSVMPSEDFRLMSDQELSDVVAFIRSQPPVDNTVPARTFGPVGKMLIATGAFALPVTHIESHDTPHRALPPAAEVSVEFGAHLAATCTGCHGANLAGGKIVGGDPSWPPARNLTPHASALEDWTYEDFVTAMREGNRPDGTALLMPMSLVTPFAQRMTDTELEAIWTYLRSLPAVATED